jgi:dienelactone hydrolase
MIDIPRSADRDEQAPPPVQTRLMPPPRVVHPATGVPLEQPLVATLVDEPRADGTIPWAVPVADRAATSTAANAGTSFGRPLPPQSARESEAAPPFRVPRALWILSAVAVGTLFLLVAIRPLMRLVLPHVLPVSVLLPKEPYALDDPAARSRVTDGWSTATFPESIRFAAHSPGIVWAKVDLNVGADRPGHNARLTIYQPEGSAAPASLGCVLGTSSGGTLLAAPNQRGKVDEDEWLPFVRAGYAVVVFGQDGEINGQGGGNTEGQVSDASLRFFAAQAGLVNARNALEFVLATMPQVDQNRIYVAGHSSAGTLALLLAAHESRLRGCIAYGAVADAKAHFDRATQAEGHRPSRILLDALRLTSPAQHAAKFSCPVMLFHSQADDVVPDGESRSMADKLRQHGKNVNLVMVPSGGHRQSLLDDGIPAAIRWLQTLERPGGLAEWKDPQTEKVKQAVAAQAAAKALETEARKLEADYARWLSSAQRLADELESAGGSPAAATVTRLGFSADSLTVQTRALAASAQSLELPGDKGPFEVLPSATRDKLFEVNKKLQDAASRIDALTSAEASRADLPARLAACVLPAWLAAGRAPTAEELAAEKKAAQKADAAGMTHVRRRDFRTDAQWAFRRGNEVDAVKLLRADLLVREPAVLVKAVGWSPALERPAALLAWSFGVELRGFPGTGPSNLRPPTAQPADRGTSAQWHLSNQMKAATGNIGMWIAEGLKARVDSEAFGDWAQEGSPSHWEHRGIQLLDFVPVDMQLKSAQAAGTDVLMSLIVTYVRGAPAGSTSLAVQLYNVETGEKLWESKPITNSQITGARRQGKNADADFASEVLKFIDDKVVLRSVPELTAGVLKRRLDQIEEMQQTDPLEALLELRYLQMASRLDGAEARRRLVDILGEENANRLMSNEQDDRRKAIESLVPSR